MVKHVDTLDVWEDLRNNFAGEEVEFSILLQHLQMEDLYEGENEKDKSYTWSLCIYFIR